MSLLRTLRILLAALGVAVALPLAAQTTKVVGSGAVITEFRGTVMIQVGTQPARPFKPGQALAPGTIIQTGKDASAVLVFPDGQICVLGEQSKFRVIEYRFDPRETAGNGASLNLIEGSLRLVLGEIGQKNPSAVRVQVGMATLAPLPSPESGGTDASVVVQGGPVAVTVQQGRIAVMLPSGPAEQVGSGQGLYIAPDGTLRRGDTGQVIQFLSQLAQGPDMQKQLADLRGFDQKIAQTVITLATVTSAVKDPSAAAAGDQVAAAEILNQLESLPAPGAVNQPAGSGPSAPAGGGSAGTPSTGGGGGGSPCAASCN